MPGVHVSRESFLKKELFKNHPEEVIEKAIATTPAKAGISLKEIDKIADEVIKYERNCVSGISAALGAPGGFAMAATIPADIFSIMPIHFVQFKNFFIYMVFLKYCLMKTN